MKQIQKLATARAVGNNAASGPAIGPADDLPPAYWASLLGDARADSVRAPNPIRARKLSEIGQHVLRVTCSRCERIVEIRKADALRLYGPDAVWRDVAPLCVLPFICVQASIERRILVPPIPQKSGARPGYFDVDCADRYPL